MIFSITNFEYEFPHELPNGLRLMILGKNEISEKCESRVETSAESYFQILGFANASLNTRKSRYQTFLFLSSFIEFLCFIPNILARKQNFGLKSAQASSNFNFLTASISSNHLPNL